MLEVSALTQLIAHLPFLFILIENIIGNDGARALAESLEQNMILFQLNLGGDLIQSISEICL